MMESERRETPRQQEPPGLRSVPVIDPESTPIFFLPGVGGSEFEFEDLVAHVGVRLQMRPVTYPAIGARGAVLSSMSATAEVVTAEILRVRPEGSIALVGYSFGGALALEISRQLAVAGRRVVFLGILDAPFGIEELQGLFAVLRLATVPRRLAKKLVEATAMSDVTLKLMTAATASVETDHSRGEAVRRALLTHLRTKALAGWTPVGCEAAGILICTGVLGENNRRRWQALCPNLDHARIEASHESLLGQGSVERVASALIDAARRHGLLPHG